MIKLILNSSKVVKCSFIPLPCRAVPNSAIALRLLKQILNKHQDIIQQGFSAGLLAASDFQAAIGKASPPDTLPVIQRAMLFGFKRLYQEVLVSSKAAKNSFLSALIKRFETACDPVNPEEGNLKLLYLCTQVASCLPLVRMHEVLALLRPIHQIIARHGDTVLAAVKQAQKTGPSKKQSTPCIAMVYLLLLNNFFIQKYGLTRERLALLEETAEKRRAEENRELQVSAAASELLEADGLETKDVAEQYTGLKLLMQTFTGCHSFIPTETIESNGHSDAGEKIPSTSPIASRTPLWALNSTDLARAGSGKLLKRRNSSASRKGTARASNPRRKSNLSQPQQKRRRSGHHSASDSGSEHDEDLEEEYLKRRVSKPRRRLEEDLAQD